MKANNKNKVNAKKANSKKVVKSTPLTKENKVKAIKPSKVKKTKASKVEEKPIKVKEEVKAIEQPVVETKVEQPVVDNKVEEPTINEEASTTNETSDITEETPIEEGREEIAKEHTSTYIEPTSKAIKANNKRMIRFAKDATEEQIRKKVAEDATKRIKFKIEDNSDIRTGVPTNKHKKGLIITALVSIFLMLVFIFIPFTSEIKPLDFIKFDLSNVTIESVIALTIFSVLVVTICIDFYLMIDVALHFNREEFLSKVSKVTGFNFFISCLYGVGGIAYFVVNVIQSKNTFVFSIILTILEAILLVVNAVIKSYFQRDYIFVEKNITQHEDGSIDVGEIKAFHRPFPSGELLVYILLFSVLPIATLFMDLFSVYANGTIIQSPIKGIDFFIKMSQFTNVGFKMISFFFYLFIIIDAVLLLTAILLFFAKRKNFYKISVISIVFNFLFVTFISFYGLYYKIVLASSLDKMKELLGEFFPEAVLETIESVEVETKAYFLGIAAILLLIFVLVRNPSRKELTYEELDENELMDKRMNAPVACVESVNQLIKDYDLLGLEEKNAKGGKGGGGITENGEPLDVNIVDKDPEEMVLETFDACPAFTEIDAKEYDFKNDIKNRLQSEFKEPTLPSLVNFVIKYAANCRIHLSYCKEDIAAFIAGLGATRLTILQGMSGTGKTSLPKIFMEALFSNCELIEIESSWREKNELLGFYNEFSKVYTPKKFTQRLYKAALNPDIITFIVLDEMNLSRIEYYFSDFLSLMENEENNRKIKLSNVKLYNIFNNERHSYLKLEEDHTLKVPSNVWFIGTANRDESTFEISDKVYDRAHTMNFNKRAPAIVDFGAPLQPRFIKYKDFRKLLEEAKKEYEFDIEANPVIKRVEELMLPYNISFGNRIYNQIQDFVKIYCSCFDTPATHEFDAVETILLTKVVMKLENKNIDNRDYLINEFKKLKLTRCVDFISKLSEDF